MRSSDGTRLRLLEAAGEEFASQGHEGASIRAICARAGVMPPTLYYHFGPKQDLYREALAEAGRALGGEIPCGDASPAEQLRAYLRGVFRGDIGGWRYRLLARELLAPTPAPGGGAGAAVRPRFAQLEAILARACPGADARRLRALALGVVGQCLCYRAARPLALHLVGAEGLAGLDAEYLIDHLCASTLAALGLGPPLCCGDAAGPDTGRPGGR